MRNTRGMCLTFKMRCWPIADRTWTFFAVACLEFRAQFLDVANVDPFQYVTIASACMATYRSGHIQPDTIAMVPTHGYINSTNYSPDSIRWLDFVAASEGLQIQHALNGSGEHRVAGISVDGFCQETQTVYQFQGCFFHGCSSCYDGDIIHPLKGVSMATLREKTEETTRKLRTQGFHVIEMWEHEFQREKEENPDLQAFLEQHHLRDRLNPRESFFGGRTNALKLFHEGDAKYVDFTSLYPWVNKYCVYPVGHPTIITESFRDVEDYFGIIQCRVIPPRNLYLPVLPYRCRKKLMFPLCRTCALLQLQTPCTHRRRASSCRNVGNGGSQTGEKERLPRHTYLRSVPFPGIVYFSVQIIH
ncbi:uncharacterized protein LOC118195102 isoform X3 [Stegodyphus dumicola]|uniref:uncharacterized protein LOC118195102 isoform X3 n=1 Tax=Stegodyphus dumicola TaxID=202533 RepID=UPI0015A91870|nr:uncharacterized protein LOC118195102 isoform X3 [Stegodyphus dumicola]